MDDYVSARLAKMSIVTINFDGSFATKITKDAKVGLTYLMQKGEAVADFLGKHLGHWLFWVEMRQDETGVDCSLLSLCK